MSKKHPIRLPVLGNAYQNISIRKQKTPQQVANTIDYPDPHHSSFERDHIIAHDPMYSKLVSLHAEEDDEEPVDSAMQIRISQIDEELRLLELPESIESVHAASESCGSVNGLASYKDIDDMLLKYGNRLKFQMDLLSVYPEHELSDIIACECAAHDHSKPVIEIYDLLVDQHIKNYNVYIMKIYEGEFAKARTRRSSIKSSETNLNSRHSSNTVPFSERLKGSGKVNSLRQDKIAALNEFESSVAESSSSLKSDSLSDSKPSLELSQSKVSTPKIKLHLRPESVVKIEIKKLETLPEMSERVNPLSVLIVSGSEEDDVEDPLLEVTMQRSAFGQQKHSLFDNFDDEADPVANPKYASVVNKALPTFGGENSVFGATIVEEITLDHVDEDPDGNSSESSYQSLSDSEDPVNLLPPLIFADLYRNPIVQVSEPKIDSTQEVPKSITKIKENNLKSKVNMISSGTTIPTIEALLFFEIIHDERFREYLLTEKELEEYPIIRMADQADEEELNAKMNQLNEQIEKGYASAFLPRAKCYMAKKLWDLALIDLNMFIKLDSVAKNVASIYWDRHQIHLMDGNIDLVINDLDKVTEIQRDHIGAAYTKGRIYLELGLIKPSIINFNTLATLKPRHPEPFLRRGYLYEMLSDVELSHDDYRKVVKLDPLNVYARFRCGMYFFDKGFFTDALKEFQKLLHLDGTNGLYFSLKGRTYACLNRWDKAAKNINMAIKLIPNDFKAFYYRGCLISDTDPYSAIKDFSISILIEDGPENTDSYYQRGLLYHKTEQYECAVDDYLSAVGMRSGYHVAYLNLGTIYMICFKDCERALEYYEKTITCDPNHIKAYIYRGDVYYAMYKVRKNPADVSCLNNAIRDYSRAMHLAPWNPLPYLHRGRLLLEKGLVKESKDDLNAAFYMRPEESFLNKVISLDYKKDYAGIIKEYSKLRSHMEYKIDPLILLEVGKAHMNLGAYDNALGFMFKALAVSVKKRHVILLHIGHCYTKFKSWPKAIGVYTQCIQALHGYAEAYFYRGICKLQSKNERGISDIIRAIKFDPRLFAAQFFLAGYYYELNDYNKCVEYCDAAYISEKTSIKTLLLRGNAQTRLKQNHLAIDDFNLAIELEPKNSLAFYHRAAAYHQMKNIDKAITDYSINLLLEENANAYRNRGLLYWQKKDSVNALIDLKSAKELQTADANIRCLLAICLQRVHSYEESVEEFNAAIKINPFMIEAYIGRGNVHVIIGNLANARKDYSRVLHLFPRNQEAFVNIAYSYQMEGRSKKAWEIFNSLLALDPSCTMGLEGRAIVNYHNKNYFNALIDITRALEIEPSNAEFLTNKGLIHKAMNDYSAAYNAFTMATKADSKFALAYFNIGNLYFANARMTDANQSFTKALSINDNDKLSLLNRGITRVMQDELKGAMADFDQCILLDSYFAQAYTNRGHLKHILEDFVGAEKDFTKSLEIQPGDNLTLYKRAKSLGSQGHLLKALKDINTSYIYETTKTSF